MPISRRHAKPNHRDRRRTRWRLPLAVIGWLGTLVSMPAATADPQPDDATVISPIGRAVYVGHEMVLDYDPRPTLVTEESHVPRARFRAIDAHCHWSLEQEPAALLAAMDARNVRAAVNLSGGWGRGLERMLKRFHTAAPGRLLIFCTPEFARVDEPSFTERTLAALERARQNGAAGVKVFKDLGLRLRGADHELLRIDDERFDPIWAKAGELGMPVLIHTADPIAFFQPVDQHNERWMQLKRHPDWSFHGEAYPSRDELLAQRDRVIERHPDTLFIGAHVGNSAEDLAAVAERLERYPNFYVDISGRVAELGRQPYSARRFIIDHQDRVLFGTDRYPGRVDQPRYAIYFRFLETDDEYFRYYDHPFAPAGEWRIYGIHLPDDVLRKVYHDNAARVLGLTDDAGP